MYRIVHNTAVYGRSIGLMRGVEQNINSKHVPKRISLVRVFLPTLPVYHGSYHRFQPELDFELELGLS